MNGRNFQVRAAALAACFNASLGERFKVRCIGGFVEPEYLPANCHDDQSLAQLRYTRDYAASALHEISHWCIAGAKRRQLVDFGYAYQPPPRNSREQQRFFRNELAVQSLEAYFAKLTGIRFVPSADNFSCSDASLSEFAEKVEDRLIHLLSADNLASPHLPIRARQFVTALITSGLASKPQCAQVQRQPPSLLPSVARNG